MTRLLSYKNKRRLDSTPEPQAQLKRSKKALIFVIQRHDASHLHFDLRLELDGVLKSWALPKGPPLLAPEKRLAIMVEDHPYSYKDFHGTIPAGHYGAGEVEIWDSGTYSIPGISSVSKAQAYMRAGLKKGHISFWLHGDKLDHYYSLVRIATSGSKESWLMLIKSSSLADEPTYVPMPQRLAPMLARLTDEPFDREGWIFELKLDGYRALAYIKSGSAQLISRNFLLFNKYYPLIIADLEKHINHDVILDGEIVVLDVQGRSRFQLLQNYQENNSGHLFYYVFDVLYCDGHDLRDTNLLERKALLEQLLAPLYNTHIRYNDHIEKTGIKLFKQAKKLDLEGIVAKNGQSIYRSGRSSDWLKIKSHRRQEVVIGGFTEPQGSRHKFGSLLVGYYDNKQLFYAGNVGTGFSDRSLQDLATRLEKITQKKSPFVNYNSPNSVTFVKPLLVCEVSFSEWTKDGHMRHPVFEGLRQDKKALEVSRE